MRNDLMLLSMFPGLDLFGLAFEELGFQVLKGPDKIFGGDVKRFHVLPGYFKGVIGGPPCQKFSNLANVGAGTTAVDLIDEFVRVVDEAAPDFVVMENVRGAIESPHIPKSWNCTVLRDWDCGGLTARTRAFWSYPFKIPVVPVRPGTPSLSVKATTYSAGRSTNPFLAAKSFLPGDLPIERYAELQGFSSLVEGLTSIKLSRAAIISLLGNGVPHALGVYVAACAMQFLTGESVVDRITQVRVESEKQALRERLLLEMAKKKGLI